MKNQIQHQLTAEQIQSRVCDVVATQQRLRRAEVHPDLRLIEDLHIDSLDVVELMMALEDEFDVSLPDDSLDPTYKEVFTRQHLSLRDVAELVRLRLGTGRPQKRGWRRLRREGNADKRLNSFTQLGGRIRQKRYDRGGLHDELMVNRDKLRTYRRSTDGMTCVQIPQSDVSVGSDAPDAMEDERPAHIVPLSGFLMDCEPVSTTAYCRFLNSIGPVPQEFLEEWFLLTSDDKRQPHELVRPTRKGWQPVAGTERFPMILVSWFGANAYSLWANRQDWTQYRNDSASCLPSEAQWEYAAHGPRFSKYPWGNDDPDASKMNYSRYTRGQDYQADTLPLAEVNQSIGVSPFGLRHMASNIWHWCRDSYLPGFYKTPAAIAPDAVCQEPTHIKSERGGSWIGPAFLCRTTYRRGRSPAAKGRCLGFRCVGALA
ncbi:MAG TPA: SUMF1/EgtB/PvdO family nonheme iron enzyme [Tepidisphaeraceae bacterium]|jgi:acyl carrier protein